MKIFRHCIALLKLVIIWNNSLQLMFISLLLLISTSLFSNVYNNRSVEPSYFHGAWEMKKDDLKTVKIFTSGYFIYSTYNLTDNTFIEAGGGTWEMTSDGIIEKYEFQTSNPDWVSEEIVYSFTGDHDKMPLSLAVKKNGKSIEEVWTKIDDGNSPLFGAWRITQRERNGEMGAMQQGPRKTMKVLSGTRFQWAAFNVETREFSGTGGGTFTTKDGKYTENIEFFSRDNSRVGASLEFDFSVEGKYWHHQGLSSRGEPIYEIWENQDQ